MSKGLLPVLPTPSENNKGWPWQEETPATVYDNKNNWPKISIVTPGFNQGIFLEETLRSILLQNYPNLELIVIDGGSKDESVEIIKKYEPWITYWVSEKDKGQSDAINKGFKKVTGEIMTWLNSDDLFTPGALHQVAGYFSTLPADTGLIHGGTIIFKDEKIIKNDWAYHNPSLQRYLAGMAFPQPSAFFLKKYFDKIGGQVNEQLHYGMDYDLFCRLVCVCNFVPVKDLFSKYRIHDSSKSVTAQDNFIGDWTKSFINLCKNTEWNDVLQEMESTGLYDRNDLDWFQPFTFAADKQILVKADKRKTLFYHYTYVFKAFYWSGQMDKAKQLLGILKSDFPDAWLNDEKGYLPMIKKLAMPGFMLRLLKKIKKMV